MFLTQSWCFSEQLSQSCLDNKKGQLDADLLKEAEKLEMYFSTQSLYSVLHMNHPQNVPLNSI